VHNGAEQDCQNQQAEHLTDHAGRGSTDGLLQNQLVIKGDFDNADFFAVKHNGQRIDLTGVRAGAIFNIHVQVISDPDVENATEVHDAFYLTADLNFVVKPQAGAQGVGITAADAVQFLFIGLGLLLIIPQQNGAGNQKRHSKRRQ